MTYDYFSKRHVLVKSTLLMETSISIIDVVKTTVLKMGSLKLIKIFRINLYTYTLLADSGHWKSKYKLSDCDNFLSSSN